MTYAAATDLDSYFGAAEVLIAADRDGDGTADVGVVADAIAAAEEEIDSYLAVRYDLPLSSVPGVLKRVCCDLTMYHMSFGHAAMTEEKRTRYTDGISWLGKLSKGVVTLGLEEATVTVQDEATIATSSETRLFSRTKMDGLF